MIRLASLALASTILAAASSPTDNERFASLMARGRQAMAAGDHAAAREALEKAVAMKPGDAAAHHALARALAEDKKYQPAALHLKEALRLSPGLPGALIDLAAIEQYSGRFEAAAGYYRQALAAGPDPRAQRGLATLLARQGKLDEAIASLKSLAQASPGDAETRYQLGLAVMQQGGWEEAAGHFEGTLRLVPNHLGASFNLGNCLQRLGRTEEAKKALEAFRGATEDDARRLDRERRGWFLLQEADRKLTARDARGALASLDEAVKISPSSAAAHAMRAQVLEAMGDDRGAVESYRKAADLDRSDAIILVETGRLLGKTGRMAEAVRYLQMAAEADPLMPDPHRMLAAAFKELGRHAEAAAEEETFRRLSAQRGAGAPPAP